jgi:glycosyltransferase involved in cell wall biosynthesis
MVLLSTAEASPLAIKEGLMAGLGLVLSEAVASEIELKPWITVVPESEIWNKAYVQEAILKNRMLTKGMKQEIRKDAMSQWNWPTLIQKYVANLEAFV